MSLESNQPTGKKCYIIIYNPHSGRDKKNDLKKEITDFFKNHGLKHELIEVEVENWKVIDEKILEMTKKHPDCQLLAVGGDGTLRRIFQFIYLFKVKLPVAFVPIGSANITAHSLNIPLQTEKALELAISGRPEEFDLGVVNDKFVFFIGAGFGKIAELSIKPTRQDKKKLGIFAYLKSTCHLFKNYRNYSFILQIDDQKAETNRASSLLIFNHFDFHILKPKRKIAPNDGWLDLFSSSSSNFLGLLKAAFLFYFTDKENRVLIHRKAKTIRISKQDFDGKFHVDGQHKAVDSSELIIKILPKEVKLIVSHG